jgi:hypothetical protein
MDPRQRVAISMPACASHNGEKDVMPRPEIVGPHREYHGHHGTFRSLPLREPFASIAFAEAETPRRARSRETKIRLHRKSRRGDTIMMSKFDIVALGAFLTVLVAPGVVSAQEGSANYSSAQALREAGAVSASPSQLQMSRFTARLPSGAYGDLPGTLISSPAGHDSRGK